MCACVCVCVCLCLRVELVWGDRKYSLYSIKTIKPMEIVNHIQWWSELLAPLANMIKEGCENESALLIIFIFY